MRLFGRTFRMAWATAMLAVALFSYASVASVVMQAGGGLAFSGPIPASAGMDMASMDMGHGGPAAPAKGQDAGKSEICAFCSAAAHVAVLAFAPPVVCPSVVAWRAPPIPQDRAQCGPPAFRATARGPPSPSLMS